MPTWIPAVALGALALAFVGHRLFMRWSWYLLSRHERKGFRAELRWDESWMEYLRDTTDGDW